MTIVFYPDQVREIIKSKKEMCPVCNGTGEENWNEHGEDVRPGPSTDAERVTGVCENCNAIGWLV